MGYDLHITRATDWTQNLGSEIPCGEWLALVDQDPDLSRDPTLGPHAARSAKHGWFDWFEGNVFTTDPSRVAVAKMIEMARQLGAVLQGDDGEFYESARQWTRVEPGR